MGGRGQALKRPTKDRHVAKVIVGGISKIEGKKPRLVAHLYRLSPRNAAPLPTLPYLCRAYLLAAAISACDTASLPLPCYDALLRANALPRDSRVRLRRALRRGRRQSRSRNASAARRNNIFARNAAIMAAI